MTSEILSQFDLPLGKRAGPSHVDPSVIARQTSKHAALMLCIQASGLEDKEIYQPLGIGPGQWTRIKKGEAHFPNNKEHALMDLCGNEIPLLWDAFKRGYELKPLLSTVEQQLAEVTRERDEARQELATIQKFVRATGR